MIYPAGVLSVGLAYRSISFRLFLCWVSVSLVFSGGMVFALERVYE
jgi:hypothetical protein